MKRSFSFAILSAVVFIGTPKNTPAQSVTTPASGSLSQLLSIQGDRAELPVVPASRAVPTDNPAQTLSTSKVAIQIPEPDSLTIDPAQIRPVNLQDFNRTVMPQIMALKFFSYNKNAWLAMPYKNIYNNCFARRTAVDAFLWFAAPLKADVTKQGGLEQYLLPGFNTPDFKTKAWIETARINVIGELKPPGGHVAWSNHETVIVNTDQGVRVVDPSFANQLLTLEQWFAYFAPGKACLQVSPDMLRDINLQLARTQQFHQTWDPKVPHCGYTFGQRLDAGDMISATAGYYGTAEQKFLSAKFNSTFETDLSQ